MQTLLIVIAIVILAIIIFAIYRLQKVKKQNRELNAIRFERVGPLYDKLEKGELLSAEEILPYAENILTRDTTFLLLSQFSKKELFPNEYFNIIKSAESQLANWLEFPTELDACPDEMEHVKRVTIDFDGNNNFVHYEVFKYRVNAPHWAAENGWMPGIVGPYFDDSKPYDRAGATFSRVSSTVDKTTPEAEARWVHEHISMRKR